MGHVQQNSINIRAVSPSYLDATFGHFYENNNKFRGEKFPCKFSWFTLVEFASGTELLEELYSVQGSSMGVIGTYNAESLGIMNNKEDHFLLSKYLEYILVWWNRDDV